MATSELFARKSSGLVREAGFLDTVFFNWASAGGVGLGIVYTISWALYAFPGVNLLLALVVTVPFAVAGALTFSLLSSAMPRSGGDYLFVSRILNPVWGFISGWTEFISVVTYNALVIWFVPQAFLTTTLGIIGLGFNNEAILNLAFSLFNPIPTLVVSAIVLVFVSWIVYRGIRTTLRTLSVFFVVGLIGLLINIIIIGTSNRDTFVANFNEFANPIMETDNAYGAVIAQAEADGLVSDPNAGFLDTTLPTLPIMFYYLGYAIWSMYMGGEMKGGNQRNRQVSVMLVPTLLNAVLIIVVYAFMFRVIGYEFLSAANYNYWWTFTWALPVAPFVNLFASLLTPSPILNALLAITWAAFPIPMVLLIMVQFTRQIFAWAFDGVIPEQLADVNERTHSPTKAIVVSALLTFIAIVLLVYFTTAVFTFIAIGLLMSLVMFLSVAIAGVVFPYRRKEMYEGSPAKWEIAGIPVITIASLLLGLFVILEWVLALSFPGLGITDLTLGLTVLGGVMGIGALIFAISWYSRKSQGIDPSLVYKEIPPE